MNRLSLEYFLQVEKERNMTKAAATLGISQQALSYHISRLEKEFGVRLFKRTNPLTPTIAGKQLVKRAEEYLRIYNSIYKEMKDIKDFKKAELNIGVSYTHGKMILPDILPLYKSLFPQVTINLVEGNTTYLKEILKQGELDLIIGHGTLDYSEVETESIILHSEQVMLLLVIPNQILDIYFPDTAEELCQKLENYVDLTLLSNCPFLLMNSHYTVRKITDEFFSAQGVTPRVILEMENSETMLSLCLAGMGIMFYPDVSTNFEQRVENQARLFPMGYKSLTEVLYISYSTTQYVTRAMREFITLAQKVNVHS